MMKTKNDLRPKLGHHLDKYNTADGEHIVEIMAGEATGWTKCKPGFTIILYKDAFAWSSLGECASSQARRASKVLEQTHMHMRKFVQSPRTHTPACHLQGVYVVLLVLPCPSETKTFS